MDQPATHTWWTSLVAKAAFLLVGVVAVTAGAVGTLLASQQAASYRAELDRRGSSLLQTLERHQDLHLAVALRDATAAGAVLDATLASNEDASYLAALDASGRVLAAAARGREGARAVSAELRHHVLSRGGAAASDGRIRRFTEPVTAAARVASDGFDLPGSAPAAEDRGRTLGWLVLGLEAGRVGDEAMRQTFRTVGATGIVLLAAFLAFFGILSRRTGRMMAFAEALAAGDLAAELDDASRDELGRLATALRRLRDSTLQVVGQLREASNSLQASSGEVLRSAQVQLEQASRQAASVAETGATVAHLRENFQQARTQAEGVIDLARKSEASSTEGERAVGMSVGAMEDIREQVEAMARTLASLVERGRQIADIIEVVNDLAEQSNVVALNAAIEAARAGEAGRGFAVVAREVRSLAERSQQSTAQVRAILDDIERAARESSAVVEEARRRADGGVGVAKGAGESIRDLARAIVESSSAATLIAQSTQQQAVGVDQIWQAMRDIDHATSSAAAGIGQLERASQAIGQHSERMAAIVRRYRVDGVSR